MNHWPREGQHNVVQAKEIAALEQRRSHNNKHTVQTPTAHGDAIVRASETAERQYAVARGNRILNQASQQMGEDRDQAFKLDYHEIKREAQAHLMAQFRQRSEDHSRNEKVEKLERQRALLDQFRDQTLGRQRVQAEHDANVQSSLGNDHAASDAFREAGERVTQTATRLAQDTQQIRREAEVHLEQQSMSLTQRQTQTP